MGDIKDKSSLRPGCLSLLKMPNQLSKTRLPEEPAHFLFGLDSDKFPHDKRTESSPEAGFTLKKTASEYSESYRNHTDEMIRNRFSSLLISPIDKLRNNKIETYMRE